MSFGEGLSFTFSSDSDDQERIPLPSTPDYDAEMNDEDEEDDTLIGVVTNNNEILARLIQEANLSKNCRGSIPGCIVINRNREEGHHKLWNDYFSDNLTYPPHIFRRRFRMQRSLFLRIHNAVIDHDDYFVQRRDATGKLGLSSLQKLTGVFRMLAYGTAADSTNEYIRIGETTVAESLKKFCRAVIEVFGAEYLRSPNTIDVARLLRKGEKRGFPGMLGSLDCMHWAWKNCPTAWSGQYSGRHGSPTIILEVVASHDLWIWHAYFGLPGSNNDINVLQASDLFANLAAGITPPANYTIQGKNYNVGYYLADGIYPKWSTIVQTISKPQGQKKIYFAMMQEMWRKDVERAFGVLQSRFVVVKNPARLWSKYVIHDVMNACIIMHNMIVEDERVESDDEDDSNPVAIPKNLTIPNEPERIKQFLARHKQIQDRDAHFELRNALIEHLWERHGNALAVN